MLMQIESIPIAFSSAEVIALALTSKGKHDYMLRVYLRGCSEPPVIVGDQVLLSQAYDWICDNLGGVMLINA